MVLEIEGRVNQGSYDHAVHCDWQCTVAPQGGSRDKCLVAQGRVGGHQGAQGFLLEGTEFTSVIWGKEGLAEGCGFKDMGVNGFISRVLFQKFQHSIEKPENVRMQG